MIMELLGVVLFILVWKFSAEFSSGMRTILFWTINIISGIMLSAFIIAFGKYIQWGYPIAMLAAIAFGFWLGETHPKHPGQLEERREIIPDWADFILFLDVLVIWGGLMMLDAWFLKEGI